MSKSPTLKLILEKTPFVLFYQFDKLIYDMQFNEYVSQLRERRGWIGHYETKEEAAKELKNVIEERKKFFELHSIQAILDDPNVFILNEQSQKLVGEEFDDELNAIYSPNNRT